MKKILLVGLVLMVFGSVTLMAEGTDEEIDAAMEEVEVELEAAMEELGQALDEIPGSLMIRTKDDSPKIGAYLSDINFEEAYEMHYPYCYGVLVTGVTSTGASQKAGIIKGDIVMEFDGKKAKFEDHLVKLIKSRNIGDEIGVKVFRSEEIFETTLVLQGAESKNIGKNVIITKDGKKRVKKSVGYGGGSWIPVWFQPNDEFEDINYILTDYGFNDLDTSGILMQGGGGKGNVGKGWFLGGMGTGYYTDKKVGYTVNGNDVTRRMQLSVGYGGVTLDKRFAFTKNIIGSLGFMLGGGGYDIIVAQTDGVYDWNDLDGNLSSSDNNTINLQKSYVLFQPKAMVMVRLLSWLGIRAEAGYMLSHSITDGWDVYSVNDTFEINNSPNTSFDGYTFSIGPWFGF